MFVLWICIYISLYPLRLGTTHCIKYIYFLKINRNQPFQLRKILTIYDHDEDGFILYHYSYLDLENEVISEDVTHVIEDESVWHHLVSVPNVAIFEPCTDIDCIHYYLLILIHRE